MSKINEPQAIIFAAVIGLIGAFIGGYFVIKAAQEPFKLSLQATQTAEAGMEVGTTETPQSVPTATATVETDPTMYDNFDNPEFDGSFNKSQWQYLNEQSHQSVQQDGILIVTYKGRDETVGLSARKYDNKIIDTLTSNTPTFFEAKLMMLHSENNSGNVHINFASGFKGGYWFSQCGITERGEANCVGTPWPMQEGHDYSTSVKLVDYGKWYTFRIEVNPATMTFTYYIDGQVVGSHIPVDSDELKSVEFSFSVGVAGENVTGYIDDVRIGHLGR